MPHKCKTPEYIAIIAYSNYIDYLNLLACHGQQKTKQIRYTIIKKIKFKKEVGITIKSKETRVTK